MAWENTETQQAVGYEDGNSAPAAGEEDAL